MCVTEQLLGYNPPYDRAQIDLRLTEHPNGMPATDRYCDRCCPAGTRTGHPLALRARGQPYGLTIFALPLFVLGQPQSNPWPSSFAKAMEDKLFIRDGAESN
jgi:hypothetical protein